MEHWKNLSLANIIEEIDGIVYVEEWADISGLDGVYLISSFGRVKSLRYKHLGKEIILKQWLGKKGYLSVSIFDKNRYVHRLVGCAFVPNEDGKPFINHKKGIKTNNFFSGLEWCTMGENNLHAFRELGREPNKGFLGRTGSLHHASKPVKCTTLDIVFGSVNQAAKQLGISQGNLWGYLKGTEKNTSGLDFRYINL